MYTWPHFNAAMKALMLFCRCQKNTSWRKVLVFNWSKFCATIQYFCCSRSNAFVKKDHEIIFKCIRIICMKIVKPIHIFIHSIIYNWWGEHAKWVLLILLLEVNRIEIVNIQHKNAVTTWYYFILAFFRVIFRIQHYRIQSLPSGSPKPKRPSPFSKVL